MHRSPQQARTAEGFFHGRIVALNVSFIMFAIKPMCKQNRDESVHTMFNYS